MKSKLLITIVLILFGSIGQAVAQDFIDTLNAARKASNDGYYRKALKYYKSAEGIKPKEVDLSQEMGQTAYKAGDFETAERCFDQLADNAKSGKQRSKHLTDSGISSMGGQNYQSAEDKFKDALRNDPSNEKARQLLMEAKRMRKQQEEEEQKKKDQEGDDESNPSDDNKQPNNGKNKGGDKKDGQNGKGDQKDPSKGDGQPQESTLEDRQTERRLDELMKQEADAKRRMNGNNGSNPSKKADKDW